ncbi:MAG: GTP-binding protein [Planctomycetaceae bacterium]|nr:MAG: GTP-binding protein [Planctomycetaceae bacterium]
MADTTPGQACLLTGNTRGAVATIGVVGNRLGSRLSRLLSPVSGDPILPGHVRYANWHGETTIETTPVPSSSLRFAADSHPSGVPESVVLTRRADLSEHSPHAGWESWEIHCHGGIAAANRLLADLRSAGFATLAPQMWSLHFGSQPNDDRDTAFENLPGEQSGLVRETLQVLIRTQTTRTAAIALDQYRSGLRDFVRDSRQEMAKADGIAHVRDAAARALEFAELGRHLDQPWRVVLAGPPNVGKSSLINAILGFRRSITMDSPGTTRDVLEARAVIDGWPIRFSDTAGLRRDADSAIEVAGIEAARRELAQADLVVWVTAISAAADFDRSGSLPDSAGSNPIQDSAESLTRRGCRELRVINQVDRLPQNLWPPADDRTLTSAVSGNGIDELRRRIVDILIPKVPAPGEAVPLVSRQRDRLQEIANAADEASLRAALDRLADEPAI